MFVRGVLFDLSGQSSDSFGSVIWCLRRRFEYHLYDGSEVFGIKFSKYKMFEGQMLPRNLEVVHVD